MRPIPESSPPAGFQRAVREHPLAASAALAGASTCEWLGIRPR